MTDYSRKISEGPAHEYMDHSQHSSQSGKRALVTGATGGLGYETSLELARAGAEVILTGRNEAKGQTALERIRREVPNAQIRFEPIDLASPSRSERDAAAA